MSTEFQIIVSLCALYLILRLSGRAYFKYRGTRVVTCPDDKSFVAVAVDTRLAAITAITGRPELRLRDCSRWPEMAGCGQDCLKQIASAPEACLLRNILAKWYQGKSCAYCARVLGAMDWMEHRPALMSPERVTLEWHEIAPERVYQVMSTHQPVCWNCHIAEKFRREREDLVLDSPWRRDRAHWDEFGAYHCSSRREHSTPEPEASTPAGAP
ncbi:MAG: hypothetical protein HY650_01105 [Acidobacteria bacterium]|nr:hypothetical protein [Acidobacteriota bacterium]